LEFGKEKLEGKNIFFTDEKRIDTAPKTSRIDKSFFKNKE